MSRTHLKALIEKSRSLLLARDQAKGQTYTGLPLCRGQSGKEGDLRHEVTVR